MQNRRKHILIIVMAIAMVMATAICVSAASVNNASGRINSAEGLNVRKAASADSKILGSLADNTKIAIKAVVFEKKSNAKAKWKWYRISYNGKTGYVRSDYVDGIKYTAVDAKTNTTNVNYRKGAGKGMDVAGTIKKKATKVKVLLKAVPAAGTEGSSKTWYMIQVNGKKYYACSKYFKLIDSKADEETKKTEEEAKKADEEAKKKAEEEAKKADEEAKKKAEEEAKKAAEEAAAKVKITVSNLTYPSADTPVTEGRAFSLSGKITASEKMSNIDIGIQDTDDNWVIRVPVQPDSTTFNISTVDNDIKFGMLDAGTYKYVAVVKVNGVSKQAFSHKFTVVSAVNKTLTDKMIEERINELVDALAGTYFTVDQKPANGSVDEDCNVEKVIKQNSIVLELLKANKGGTDLSASLLPSHYNPGGIAQQRGYSCCGFANFAGWYIAADTITDDVSFKPIKTDVAYNYDNMSQYAKIGDILRSSSHSYMVISVENDGCMVLDCNWDYQSIVKKHKIEWGKYSSVTINRAINRVS